MNAYFASRVAINIASSVPIVGIPTQQFLSGGPDMGTLTINRFFGLHVWLMPAALVGLVGLHLMIFRHNGSAGPPVDKDLKKLPQGRFWPNQMFMDAVVSFAVFAIMVALAIFSPAPLDDKADPTKNFIAYPAWYFLALYGLLRIAGGVPTQFALFANLLATVVLPGGLVTALILLPFIDRNPSRQLSRRPWIVGITALSLVLAIGLSIYSQLAIQQEQVDAGINPNGPGVANADDVYKKAAVAPANAAGAKIFADNCASCHGAAGAGGVGPALAGNPDVSGDAKPLLHTLMYGLTGKAIGGKTFAAPMPAWKDQLKPADIAAVASYIRASWGNTGAAVTVTDLAAVKK
jgi:ubiquinol-cytochrome c reductase cytochrome b subunit